MIDLLPNTEQEQIGDTVRRFLADTLPVERFRDRGGRKPTLDKDVWPDLSALGTFGLSIPENHGGTGLSMAEEIMAAREYGRFLVTPTLLGTVLAARLASAAGDSDLAASMVSGARRAAIINPLVGSKLGATVSGEFHLFDAEPADLMVGWNEQGAVLLEQSAITARKAAECLDPAVRLERVTIGDAKSLVYRTVAETPIWQIAHLLLAAALTGIIEAVRDESVEYAKTRVQFGNPIGIYQAVKHRCSDMALWAEAAWSQTAWAALVFNNQGEDGAFQAANAKMVAAEAALDAARRGIQIFGGMGFTAEVNMHLFLKRAHLYGQLGGDARGLSEKLLDLPLSV